VFSLEHFYGYRGMELGEFFEVMRLGHWGQGSREPMSQDAEVLKLVASEAWYTQDSEEAITEWLSQRIPWAPDAYGIYQGLNLTTLENAGGYGPILAAVECEGDVVDFGVGYSLAGQPELCKIVAFSWDDKWYRPF